MTPVYTTREYFAGGNDPNLRNLRKKSLAPMQYKKYVDITMLDEDCRRVKREQNTNYADWKRRVSCVPAGKIIQEF